MKRLFEDRSQTDDIKNNKINNEEKNKDDKVISKIDNNGNIQIDEDSKNNEYSEYNEYNESSKIYRLIFLIVSFIIIFFSVGTVFFSRETHSENENRNLQDFPEFKVSTLLDNSYTEKLEKYITDHFLFRDYFTNLEVRIKKCFGMMESNDIFFGDDEFLIENFEVNNVKLENITNIVSKFINTQNENESEIDFSMLIVPTSVYVYQNKLNDFQLSMTSDENVAIENFYNSIREKITDETLKAEGKNNNVSVNLVNVSDYLRESAETSEELLYFRLDHHWNANGAFLAYRYLGERLGIQTFDKDAFNKKVISNDFNGTNYSRSFEYSYTPDILEKYELKDDMLREKMDKVSVTYYSSDETEVETDSIYFEKYLEVKDKYSYFLENNPPYMIIRHTDSDISESSELKDKLLILKDSYANIMIPFLLNHYKEIHVIDLRYFGLPISDYIKTNNIKEVIAIYNILTFQDDLGILKLR